MTTDDKQSTHSDKPPPAQAIDLELARYMFGQGQVYAVGRIDGHIGPVNMEVVFQEAIEEYKARKAQEGKDDE